MKGAGVQACCLTESMATDSTWLVEMCYTVVTGSNITHSRRNRSTASTGMLQNIPEEDRRFQQTLRSDERLTDAVL